MYIRRTMYPEYHHQFSPLYSAHAVKLKRPRIDKLGSTKPITDAEKRHRSVLGTEYANIYSASLTSQAVLSTMPSTCYIPPPGLFFRLIGYVSQHAIFSRNAHDAGHSPVSHGEQSDQWFTLLHDSQNYPGRYAIKGTTSGRVLFSRSLFPRVGHLEGDGQHDDKSVP